MSKYLDLARQVVSREEHHKTDEDPRQEDARASQPTDQTQTTDSDLDEPYKKPASPIQERDKSDISDQSPLKEAEPWDEDVAYKLIKDALETV